MIGFVRGCTFAVCDLFIVRSCNGSFAPPFDRAANGKVGVLTFTAIDRSLSVPMCGMARQKGKIDSLAYKYFESEKETAPFI